MTSRAKRNIKAKFVAWYNKWAKTLGWIGLALVFFSFLNKEILQKKLDKRKSETETSLKVIDADERSRLQISSGRVYGSEKMDPLESFQLRLEYIMKLASTNDYLERRIHQLQENESFAHSDFLSSKGVSTDALQKSAASLMPAALAATMNIYQCRKAEGKSETQLFGKDIASFREEVSQKAESIFKVEHEVFSFLNDWADAQRNSLRQRESTLETKSLRGEILTCTLFGVGFVLALLEKASGKMGKIGVPGQGE